MKPTADENAGVDVEPIALQRDARRRPAPAIQGEGHEVGERHAHDLGLDPLEPPLRLLACRKERGLADLDPRGDEVLRLRRRAIGHRLDPAALPVPEHDQARDLEHFHAEF